MLVRVGVSCCKALALSTPAVAQCHIVCGRMRTTALACTCARPVQNRISTVEADNCPSKDPTCMRRVGTACAASGGNMRLQSLWLLRHCSTYSCDWGSRPEPSRSFLGSKDESGGEEDICSRIQVALTQFR